MEQLSVCAGSYRKMHAEGGSGGHTAPPVQAVCACLTHLFLLVEQLVAKHKGLQQLQIPILHNEMTRGQQMADSPGDLEQLMSNISTYLVSLLFTISAKAVQRSYLCLQSVMFEFSQDNIPVAAWTMHTLMHRVWLGHFLLCSISKYCALRRLFRLLRIQQSGKPQQEHVIPQLSFVNAACTISMHPSGPFMMALHVTSSQNLQCLIC